jgi:hypothetical protein
MNPTLPYIVHNLARRYRLACRLTESVLARRIMRHNHSSRCRSNRHISSSAPKSQAAMKVLRAFATTPRSSPEISLADPARQLLTPVLVHYVEKRYVASMTWITPVATRPGQALPDLRRHEFLGGGATITTDDGRDSNAREAERSATAKVRLRTDGTKGETSCR